MILWVTETYANGNKWSYSCSMLCDLPLELVNDDKFMAWRRDILNIRKSAYTNGKYTVEAV